MSIEIFDCLKRERDICVIEIFDCLKYERDICVKTIIPAYGFQVFPRLKDVLAFKDCTQNFRMLKALKDDQKNWYS